MSRGSPGGRVRTYYGKPVVKEPAWTWEVPWYLFAGGMGGVASLLAAGADLTARPGMARAARRVAGVAAVASPALLVADLGRPGRFLNMLRVFRPTSAMSVGSWILAAYAPAAAGAAAVDAVGRLGRTRGLLTAVAAALGAPMATYTGVLVADSVVPVWHEARRELPALFAASAAAAGGAATVFVAGPAAAAPARVLALAGAAAELVVGKAMHRRLGELARTYDHGAPAALERAADAATTVGGLLLLLAGRRRRSLARLGSAGLLAGSALLRWAVFEAGFASARDPEQVVSPQRARLDARRAPTIGDRCGAMTP